MMTRLTRVAEVVGLTGVMWETRVQQGASKEGEGRGEEETGGGGGEGEDVTMVGQTNKQQQGKIELLSQWTLEG